MSPSYDSFVFVSKLAKSENNANISSPRDLNTISELNKSKKNHILKLVLMLRLFKIEKNLISKIIECPWEKQKLGKSMNRLS